MHGRFSGLGTFQPPASADKANGKEFKMDNKVPRSQSSDRYKKSVERLLESSEVDFDLIKQCYWELRSQYERAVSKMSRWLIWGIVSILLFELLNRRLINSASTWFIELSHLSFLLYILPVFTSLVVLNVMALTLEGLNYTALMAEFTKQAFRSLYESGIGRLLSAHNGFSGLSAPSSIIGKTANRTFSLFGNVQAALLILGYIAFEAYAYAQLFRHEGSTNIATICSLIVSVSVTLLAIPFVISIDELPETALPPK